MDKRDALIDQLLAENKHLQARITELVKRLGLNTAIPAALFPQYWRGVPKNYFVHFYPLTGRT
jgi:hypothetical protein